VEMDRCDRAVTACRSSHRPRSAVSHSAASRRTFDIVMFSADSIRDRCGVPQKNNKNICETCLMHTGVYNTVYTSKNMHSVTM